MIGQSEMSGIEIESEYQLTGHPVHHVFMNMDRKMASELKSIQFLL